MGTASPEDLKGLTGQLVEKYFGTGEATVWRAVYVCVMQRVTRPCLRDPIENDSVVVLQIACSDHWQS